MLELGIHQLHIRPGSRMKGQPKKKLILEIVGSANYGTSEEYISCIRLSAADRSKGHTTAQPREFENEPGPLAESGVIQRLEPIIQGRKVFEVYNSRCMQGYGSEASVDASPVAI
jgi:hypothetical protein